MKILCIGDSLTEGEYGVPGTPDVKNVHAENYPYYLAQYLGCETVNAGMGGYTQSAYLRYYQTGAVDVSGADIILLLLGTNGELHHAMQTKGNEDYAALVALLQKDAPNAKLVLITPPHITTDPEKYFSRAAHNAINGVPFVRRFASENGLPLIDAAAFSEFCDETEEIMQPNDGLHFGQLGYQTLARKIADALIEMGLVLKGEKL